MGEISLPEKVKLFCGIIFSDINKLNEIKNKLIALYGEIDIESAIFDFSKTNYYEVEMGECLKKVFWGFDKLIERLDIADIKIKTNEIEAEFLNKKKGRIFNIDPGFISMPNISLATTKDFQHRIYIGKGIYLENTLRYRNGEFCDWEWTFPDFKQVNYKSYFIDLRKIYCNQLKERFSNG